MMPRDKDSSWVTGGFHIRKSDSPIKRGFLQLKKRVQLHIEFEHLFYNNCN